MNPPLLLPSSKCFQGVDLILSLIGCRFYARSRLSRIVNIILRIHSALVVYYCIIIKVVFIASDPDVVFTFNVSLIQLFHLIQQHYLWWNVKKMSLFHDCLISRISSHQSRFKLRKLGFYLLALYLFICTMCCYMYMGFIVESDKRALIIYNFYSPVPEPTVARWKSWIAYYLMLFYFTWVRNGWQMLSCFLYIYLLKAVSLVDKESLEQMTMEAKQSSCNFILDKRETPKDNYPTYRKMSLQRMEVEQAKRIFEGFMTPFPLLWFIFNFVSMITILVSVFKLGFKTSFPTEAVLCVINICITFVVLHAISQHNEQSRQLIDIIIRILLREDNQTRSMTGDISQPHILTERIQLSPMKVSLIHYLEESSHISLTALGIFNLEKEIFPAFLGSLISFAVLFVQLSQMK